jgi:hypothetical protein
MRFIGDCHGKYRRYKKLIKEVPASVCVGDMGVGFFHHGQYNYGKPCRNPPYDTMVRTSNRFISGNHDNPNVCKNHTQWIPDGTCEIINGTKLMYLGGAVSVDAHLRREGFSWWKDEELSISELMPIVDKYLEFKPDIMVTHDCPEGFADIIEAFSGRRKLDIPSNTRQALQSMIEMHQPSLFIFGHWHTSIRTKYLSTEMICLDELETLDIDL